VQPHSARRLRAGFPIEGRLAAEDLDHYRLRALC
jgi:hypothetical protein